MCWLGEDVGVFEEEPETAFVIVGGVFVFPAFFCGGGNRPAYDSSCVASCLGDYALSYSYGVKGGAVL